MSGGRGGAGIEHGVGRVLGVAAWVSVGLLALGLVGMAASRVDVLSRAYPPFGLSHLPADLASIRPEGFLWLGLLAAILTPSVRVAASLAGFTTRGERRMAAVALIVLGVICLSALLGAGG